MKTTDIVRSLNLQEGVNSKNKKALFKILGEELEANYLKYHQDDSDRHFDAAVKDLHNKWKAISNKTKWGLTDGLWNFFYATVVVKLKGKYCTSWAERKRKENEAYLIRKARREAHKEALNKARMVNWLLS